jgi:hypothetical protein
MLQSVLLLLDVLAIFLFKCSIYIRNTNLVLNKSFIAYEFLSYDIFKLHILNIKLCI